MIIRASLEGKILEMIGGAKSPSYLKLNKKGILAPTILSDFVASKLALRVNQ